jgi:hypothetical protein
LSGSDAAGRCFPKKPKPSRTNRLPSAGPSIAGGPGEPAALARAQQPSTKLIRWYRDSFEHISKWQRSKRSQLLFLEKHPIGDVDAVFLESATLVDHVRSRRAKGAGPMTVSNDLTWIGVVLRAAKSVKDCLFTLKSSMTRGPHAANCG